MSGKHRVCDGDWVCENEKCENVNFARRSHCNRCGAGKSRSKIKDMGVAIGKQMAEKSHGLFSAEDWQCKTCGNVNWARRSDCNVCKMLKIGKVESRTGYGGGFNERDNVEYNKKEESDSDGEYDEFGRKKKQFRGKVPTPPRPKDDAEEVEEKREEEEEEEDDDALDAYKLDSDDEEDDDGDVNKYDLSDEEGKKEPESTVTTKRSRSPSRSSRSSSSSNDSRKRSRSSSPQKGSRSGSSRSSRSRSDSRSNSRTKKRRRSSSDSKSRSRSRSRSGSADHYEPKKRR